MNNTLLSLQVLVKRNIKIYLKDKLTVFFSILAPLIVLLLYLLFLGKLQADSILEMEIEGELVKNILSASEVNAIINNWMVAGVMGVSCVTVAINANIVMVRDRMTGSVNDVLSSPVKRWVLYLSYVIACFLITFGISFIVLMVAILYLACSGGLMMSFVDFLAILGTMILAVTCSAIFMVLICGFIKTVSAVSALNGVFSAAIGFLIGAYLPFSMMPDYIQYIACFIPWTYSAGLFRNCFMSGVVNKLGAKIGNPDFISNIMNQFSFDLKFFNYDVSTWFMVCALLLFVVLFAILMIVFYSNKRTNFFNVAKKHKFSVKKGKK